MNAKCFSKFVLPVLVLTQTHLMAPETVQDTLAILESSLNDVQAAEEINRINSSDLWPTFEQLPVRPYTPPKK